MALSMFGNFTVAIILSNFDVLTNAHIYNQTPKVWFFNPADDISFCIKTKSLIVLNLRAKNRA